MHVFLITRYSMKQSRRDVLRTGAGLASAGVLSSLAGCGVLPGGGGGGGLLGGGGAYYSGWLAAPGEIDQGDHYTFFAGQPSQMDGNEDFSDTDAYDNIESTAEGSSGFGPTDIDFESIEQYISLGNGLIQIATGSFTVEDIAGELDDNDYDEEEELDSGELVYLNGSANIAFAFNSNYIVGAYGSNMSMDGGSTEPPEDPSSGSGQQDAGSISYGETVTSTLEEQDTYDNAYSYTEGITFQGSAGDVISIQTSTADNYDEAYVSVEGPDGELISGYSYDNVIDNLTLESDGEHTIIVESYTYYGDLTYSLSLDLLFSPDSLVDTAGTIATVQNSDTPTYADEVEAAQPLYDAIGGGVYVYGSTFEQLDSDNPEAGQLEDSVAQGLSFSFGDGEFNVTGAVVYDSEGDVDEDDVEDWADEGTLLASGQIDDISTSTNGRTATFSGVCDYDELFDY